MSKKPRASSTTSFRVASGEMSGICQYLKPCTRNKRRNLPANSGRPQESCGPEATSSSVSHRPPGASLKANLGGPPLQVGSGRASDLRSDRVHHRPAHPS